MALPSKRKTGIAPASLAVGSLMQVGKKLNDGIDETRKFLEQSLHLSSKELDQAVNMSKDGPFEIRNDGHLVASGSLRNGALNGKFSQFGLDGKLIGGAEFMNGDLVRRIAPNGVHLVQQQDRKRQTPHF